MYVVKQTYEKPGADVLLEHYLGPIELGSTIFADPRVLDILYYRSEDKSYAQIYIVWESKESYDSWHKDHETEHLELQRAMEEYMQTMGIEFHRLYPPEDDYAWASDDPRILEEQRISYDQIFNDPDPA
jgi:hypothetical protein